MSDTRTHIFCCWFFCGIGIIAVAVVHLLCIEGQIIWDYASIGESVQGANFAAQNSRRVHRYIVGYTVSLVKAEITQHHTTVIVAVSWLNETGSPVVVEKGWQHEYRQQ